jgi:hypothetical protein
VVIFWPTDDGLGGMVWAVKNIFGFTENPDFYRKWSTFLAKILIKNTRFLFESNGQKT